MCFSTALEMKFSGNSSFKKGAHADAASAYERGLDALEALSRIDVDAVRCDAVSSMLRSLVSHLALKLLVDSLHL